MENLHLFTPYLILSGGVLLTMLASIVRINTKRPAQIFTILTLIATAVSAAATPTDPVTLFNGAVEISSLGLMILMLLCGLGVLFCIGSSRYLTKEEIHYSDYYHLLLILILGGAVMAAAKNLFVLFIALETLSLPAYTLVGFRRNDSRSNEAAIKYFVLGGVLGAIFLMGAAFVFGATGTLQMGELFQWTQKSDGQDFLFYLGHVMMLIALFFKVAAVPFHLWKPDVYEGAPISVTGIMASLVTVSAFVALAKVIHIIDFQKVEWNTYQLWLKQVLRMLAVLSLVFGSVIAITQTNLKRLMAYSSISHTGYLLLGLLSTLSQLDQLYSVWVYLVGYSIMSCGVFLLMSQSDPKADYGVELIDLTGLLKRNPMQTLMWSVFLFSMAGIPFTVGFITKYVVFMSTIQASETSFAVVGALCVVVGAYAYLRPIALMVMRDADPQASTWTGSPASQMTCFVIALMVVALGVLPQGLIQHLKEIPFNH